MMVKPRYWQVAYPLAVTALCVAPTDFFLRNWYACFEAGLSKLKVSCIVKFDVFSLTSDRRKNSIVLPCSMAC